MRPSLTRRLLTLYVATILLVVGVAGGLVWSMMRRALDAELDHTLRTEAIALASGLDANRGRIEFERGVVGVESSNPQSISSDLNEPSGGSKTRLQAPSDSSQPLVQIWDEQGRVVFSSSALADAPRSFEPLSAATPSESPVWFTTRLAPNEGLSRALALHVMVPPDDDSAAEGVEPSVVGAWVLVARSLATIDRTLAQLASVLASAVGAAMISHSSRCLRTGELG